MHMKSESHGMCIPTNVHTPQQMTVAGVPESCAIRRLLPWTITAIWAVVVVVGMGFLVKYANSAGKLTAAPAQIATEPGAPTGECQLFMFVHPHCPCSVASVSELAKIMSRCEGQLKATVYFIRPASQPAGWEQGHLWNLVHSIPHVNAQIDECGLKATRFHANTSGETLVYDREGQLCFQGGITAARGHAGDNRGESAIIAIALGTDFHVESSPIFGCPLRAEAALAGR